MITKQLKDYYWAFDEEKKLLILHNRLNGKFFTMDKVRMFSLFRFLVRVAVRLSVKRRGVKK